MTQLDSSEQQLQNLLSAVTDALLAGDNNIDAILAQYNVPRANFDRLLALIRSLHVVLVGVQPSRRYVQRLKQDLLGEPESGIVARIRYLPARVQIAAGLAVVAGFMLISRRRMLADVQESREIPVLR